MAKYIVLISYDIGGAERRFFDIYRSISEKKNDVYFVVSERLYGLLSIAKYSLPNVIRIGDASDSFVRYILRYFLWFFKNTKNRDSFLYPLNCPFFLHFFSKRNVAFSITDCYEAPHFKRLSFSQIRQHLTLFFVKKVDVLNPGVFKSLQSYKFLNKRKLQQTPLGTYIVSEDYTIGKKKNRIGYLSRLIPGKGLEQYFEIVSVLWNNMENQEKESVSFYIAGYGELENYVRNTVNSLKATGIPIVFLGKADPKNLFSDTLAIFSLQEKTNYPSRVVAEALLSGSLTFIRNSGDSREFGCGYGISYISDDVRVTEAQSILRQIYADSIDWDSRARLIAQESVQRFSSMEVVDYFLDLLEME